MYNPTYLNTHISYHHANNPFKYRHLGTITTVNTTPPSVTIRSSDGTHALTSLTLSQNQLTIILNNLAFGAAQVSYTIHHYVHGSFAGDVQCTGVVDEDATRGGGSRQDQRGLVPMFPSQRRVRGVGRVVEREGASVRCGWRMRSWASGVHERRR